MITEQDCKEAIIHYIIHNQHHLKNVCKDVLSQRKILLREEPVQYHNDINIECKVILGNMINIEISKDLALDALLISSVLQDFDVIGYLS